LSLNGGAYNTAVGFLSLRNDVINSFNTAIGAGALFASTAEQNTATGAGALLSNTTGNNNTAAGAFALFSNTTGSTNTANGQTALFSNTTGDGNTAFGVDALENNTTTDFNTAVGLDALFSNVSGGDNTAVGVDALRLNSSGNLNTAVGQGAGATITTGNLNTYIGADVAGVDGENNTIRIGDNLPEIAGASACYIGGIAGQTVNPSGAGQVYIDNSGKLGVFLSSQRFKRDIRPMDNASEAILALQPVTFRYKKDIDPAGKTQFGLVAEDVEKVNPDLIVRDKEGKPYSVRYDQVNAMLLNEFLKEHQKVQKLEAALEAVAKHLKEEDAKIQRVNDQLELSKPAPQTVSNDQ
jgi:Chaperone of endosialidase